MLLRALTVVFDIPLRRKELKFFRGAMIKCAGSEQYLFHNHEGLIQLALKILSIAVCSFISVCFVVCDGRGDPSPAFKGIMRCRQRAPIFFLSGDGFRGAEAPGRGKGFFLPRHGRHKVFLNLS